MPEAIAPSPLLAAIDRLVEEKTFALDALGAIQKLREQAVKLDESLKYSQQCLSKTEAAFREKAVELDRAQQENRAWLQKQADLDNRERNIFNLEKATAVAEASRAAFTEAMKLVFMNTVTRETIQRGTPLVRHYSGGSDTVETHNTREDITRETSGQQ